MILPAKFTAKCTSNVWVENYLTVGKSYAVNQVTRGAPEPDDEIWFSLRQTDKGFAGSFRSIMFEFSEADLPVWVECEPKSTHQDAARVGEAERRT